jgi:2-amino-4-hydroxy-6-hydroxymethyldihydropteridine diphosphokinase
LNKTAAIALGSNQGDRRAHLDYAVGRLNQLLENVRVSTFIESSPAAPAHPADPAYLNAVVMGATALPARALLEELLRIEVGRGRTRPHSGAPRTLDLDLILLGEDIVHEEGLEVPHPRFRERRFVLEPLAELEPDLRDPITGLTIERLLERLPR